MKRFRTRLIFGLMAASLFVLASLGLIIGQLVKGFYVDQLEDRLGKEAALSAYALEDIPAEEWQSFSEGIKDRLDVRVTIIDQNGEVQAETELSPDELENHGDRPEITEAEDNGGTNIRFSETVQSELLYFAYPFTYGEAEEGHLRLALPVERIDNINKQIWLFVGISFSIAFILILFLSYRIANQLTQPIGQVTDVANELARGNFKARTYAGTKDEIGQLTRSINVLAYNLDQITSRYKTQQERLEALIDNMGSGLIFINDRGDITLVNQYCNSIFDTDTDKWLNELYHEVIEDKTLVKLIQEVFLTEAKVRRQMQMNAKLQVHQYEVYGAPIIGDKEKLRGIVLVLHDITELKKLEQVRKDFVANVSHELKTPVTSLKGFTETLLDGAMEDPDARKQFLDIIWKESDRLQDLISDLLELSRIEQEYFHLNWQDVKVDKAVYEVIELLYPKAEEKEISLLADYPQGLVMPGDTARFKQIMINLINNAIVYTPAGGRINVTITKETDMVKLVVADTGIGISKDEWPRIFERFYRVDKARSRNSGGTGLGLAIVKHLVEAHQGHIDVESEKDKGTTFKIFFPAEKKKD
ncbi:two-component system histidine kinase PnpS [Alteribacillus sp. HJP-4]|uniref:two-component system histidine kinase PnpS n=1 Tax=Alteribacillus sp. HJP-4 TaxID=2775394 RepID=UPI0035CD3588